MMQQGEGRCARGGASGFSMIVAMFALALGGFAQQTIGGTPDALASVEACVDRVDGVALCPGLDDETAFAEVCMSSPEHNATYKTLNACVIRSSSRCFDEQPNTGVDSIHAQWCVARVRGGVRNAVLRKLHEEAPRLSEETEAQVWELYGQAAARIETLAQNMPEGQGGLMKTAAWVLLAHQLTAPERTED